MALLLAGVALLGPWIGLGTFWQRQIILTAIMALIVSGLNLSFGFAGELSLGQAAFYAAGAYVGGWLSIHVTGDIVVDMLAGGLAAGVLGLLSGIPGLRLGGWMLAQASFFLVLLIPDIVLLFPNGVLGGGTGLAGIPPPSFAGLSLGDRQFYLATILVTAVWFVVYRNTVRSRSGVSLLVLRESPILAASVGLSQYRLKLRAYVIGAIPAGVAGALFAYVDSFVSPPSFSLNLTIGLLAASIIGGSTSVYGVFIGTALLQIVPTESSAFQRYSLVAYGVFLMLGGLLLASRVAGVGQRAARSLGYTVAGDREPNVPTNIGAAPEQPDRGEPVGLAIRGLSKNFGGLAALSDVSFDAAPGQVTALIGPNGSGKTTLLNLVCGYYKPSAGSILLGEKELCGLPAHEIARLGVGRTFQTPIIPIDLTVRQVLLSGRLGRVETPLLAEIARLPKYRRVRVDDAREVQAVMDELGLQDRADQLAVELPLGTRRVLEMARGLVGSRTVLVLDEIASGLDPDEIAYIGRIIRELGENTVVILVEHNFRFVRDIAQKVIVLAEGKVIADGPPEEIEREAAVIAKYLGSGVSLSGTQTGSTGAVRQR